MQGNRKGALAFNLGSGQGYSVQQMIDAVRRVVSEDGCSLIVEEGARRPGYPATLVAYATLVKQRLGWQPQYPELNIIIRHAWT